MRGAVEWGLAWLCRAGPVLRSGLLGLRQVAQSLSAANSKLFALHLLPGAQAPFLVNILDGRMENNSTPRREKC